MVCTISDKSIDSNTKNRKMKKFQLHTVSNTALFVFFNDIFKRI
jgi:hypothetical protein